jgi:hypothetical protein
MRRSRRPTPRRRSRRARPEAARRQRSVRRDVAPKQRARPNPDLRRAKITDHARARFEHERLGGRNISEHRPAHRHAPRRDIAPHKAGLADQEIAAEDDAPFNAPMDIEVAVAANVAADDRAPADRGEGRHRLHVHVDVALERGAVGDG